jgi:Flp pilus assembly CpaE family ATPase
MVIPEDSASLMTASNSGKALGATAPRAAITKVLRELSWKVSDVDEKATVKAPPTLWNKLTGDGKSDRRGKT